MSTRRPSLEAVLETVVYCTSETEAATRRFYDEVLGLRRIAGFAYRLGSGTLLLFNSEQTQDQATPPPHGATGSVHTCFLVAAEAYESWKTHLSQHDVTIVDETTWDNGARSFYFHDPAGNLLEIAESDMWPR